MRVDGAAGPLALGPKGSIRDRLTPPGWVQGLRPRELYSTTALARYGAYGAIIYRLTAEELPRSGIQNGARRALTSPAERYYITPEGGARRTSPEGGADPGLNPWRPGPKARRRHQPSRRSRVNLREYSQAPIPPQKPLASNIAHSKKALIFRLVLLS